MRRLINIFCISSVHIQRSSIRSHDRNITRPSIRAALKSCLTRSKRGQARSTSASQFGIAHLRTRSRNNSQLEKPMTPASRAWCITCRERVIGRATANGVRRMPEPRVVTCRSHHQEIRNAFGSPTKKLSNTRSRYTPKRCQRTAEISDAPS